MPSPPHFALFLCVLFAVVAERPRAARAAVADDAATETARRHHEQAVKYYDLGEFAAALKEFKAAYLARQDPALLYNIGQSYWKLGDLEAAVHSYRAYLRQAGKARNANEVEARIQDLKRRIAAGESRPFRPTEPMDTQTSAAPVREATAASAPAAQSTPLPPAPEPVPATPPSIAAPADRGENAAARTWIVWSAVAVVVVAAVIGGVIISGGETAEPVRGNVAPELVNLTP